MKFVAFFLIFFDELLRHHVHFKLLFKTDFFNDFDQLCPIEMNDLKVFHFWCLKAIKFIVKLSLFLVVKSCFYLFSLNGFLDNAVLLERRFLTSLDSFKVVGVTIVPQGLELLHRRQRFGFGFFKLYFVGKFRIQE